MDDATSFSGNTPSSSTTPATTSSSTAPTPNSSSTSAPNIQIVENYLNARFEERARSNFETHLAPFISNLVTETVRSNCEGLSEKINEKINAIERRVADDLGQEGTPMQNSPDGKQDDDGPDDDDNDGDDEGTPRRNPTVHRPGRGPGKGKKGPVALGVRCPFNFQSVTYTPP